MTNGGSTRIWVGQLNAKSDTLTDELPEEGTKMISKYCRLKKVKVSHNRRRWPKGFRVG